MVSCTKYDIEQDYAEFYADTKGEISNLPDLTHSGKAQLQNINHDVEKNNHLLMSNADDVSIIFYFEERGKFEGFHVN